MHGAVSKMRQDRALPLHAEGWIAALLLVSLLLFVVAFIVIVVVIAVIVVDYVVDVIFVPDGFSAKDYGIAAVRSLSLSRL